MRKPKSIDGQLAAGKSTSTANQQPTDCDSWKWPGLFRFIIWTLTDKEIALLHLAAAVGFCADLLTILYVWLLVRAVGIEAVEEMARQ